MELYQLKYFQTIARLQHISKASEELNVSQPALSMTISQVEAELGVKLFDRRGRNIELNAFGKVFLDGVNNMFRELENAKSVIKDMSNEMANHISLSTTNSRLLFGVLKEYLANNTNVIIHQSCDTGDNIVKQLQSGSIDFCISAPPIETKDIGCEILREEEIVLIVPNSHRFAGRKSIHLSEVSGDPFIVMEQNYSYRTITDKICRSAGFVPNIVFEVDDALMYEMLNIGRGICLVPRYVVAYYEKYTKDFSLIEIEGLSDTIKIGISWLKHKYLSKTLKDFKDFVISNYNNYCKEYLPFY
jgi:Transcriptional regulator